MQPEVRDLHVATSGVVGVRVSVAAEGPRRALTVVTGPVARARRQHGPQQDEVRAVAVDVVVTDEVDGAPLEVERAPRACELAVDAEKPGAEVAHDMQPQIAVVVGAWAMAPVARVVDESGLGNLRHGLRLVVGAVAIRASEGDICAGVHLPAAVRHAVLRRRTAGLAFEVRQAATAEADADLLVALWVERRHILAVHSRPLARFACAVDVALGFGQGVVTDRDGGEPTEEVVGRGRIPRVELVAGREVNGERVIVWRRRLIPRVIAQRPPHLLVQRHICASSTVAARVDLHLDITGVEGTRCAVCVERHGAAGRQCRDAGIDRRPILPRLARRAQRVGDLVEGRIAELVGVRCPPIHQLVSCEILAVAWVARQQQRRADGTPLGRAVAAELPAQPRRRPVAVERPRERLARQFARRAVPHERVSAVVLRLP